MPARDPATDTREANVPGNYFDKYATRNPVARALVQGFLRSFDTLVSASQARAVLEVGCGEGHLTARLARAGLSVRAVDVEPGPVAEARARFASGGLDGKFEVRSVYELEPADRAELVVCCEVLEHLSDPERALSIVSSLADPWLLVSVPREPLWRLMNMARGKYLGRFGNTPGHLQHFSRRAFVELVARHATIEAVTLPLPWTMVLARRRDTGEL